MLSGLTRHFLLMTAKPHNGKEEDFQLFLALLDGDRFEGRFRDGVHAADVSDLPRTPSPLLDREALTDISPNRTARDRGAPRAAVNEAAPRRVMVC